MRGNKVGRKGSAGSASENSARAPPSVGFTELHPRTDSGDTVRLHVSSDEEWFPSSAGRWTDDHEVAAPTKLESAVRVIRLVWWGVTAKIRLFWEDTVCCGAERRKRALLAKPERARVRRKVPPPP
jgi:hypothetical protein